ncbi:MAG: ATPase [Streptosporangiales bacterium]|nr:ATPase [Streptosporangiales bacterium]
MTERLILAVDGGNSKTDVALVTDEGELLGHVRGPGSSPHVLGVDGAVRLLGATVWRVRVDAGRDDAGPVARAEVYLAGADLPAEVELLRKQVARTGWATASTVDNDGYALLRAGTERRDAVAVVCGAGIGCVGRRSDGRRARLPALGRTTGDWGGGAQVGYEALWLAARAEDGRGQPTALREAVAAHFGRASVAEVGEAMHVGAIPERRAAELAAVLFAVAAAGDELARTVVDRLATEIVLMARVVLGRLELLRVPAALVLGGGVVRAQHAVLRPLVRSRLREAAPEAQLVVVTDPPVLGAALAGLDALGATDRAKRRLTGEVRRHVGV